MYARTYTYDNENDNSLLLQYSKLWNRNDIASGNSVIQSTGLIDVSKTFIPSKDLFMFFHDIQHADDIILTDKTSINSFLERAQQLLSRVYDIVEDEGEIINFISNDNDFLNFVLYSAIKIKEFFRTDCKKLGINLESDPMDYQNDLLIAQIYTELSAENALSKLDNILYNWYFDFDEKLTRRFSFDIARE